MSVSDNELNFIQNQEFNSKQLLKSAFDQLEITEKINYKNKLKEINLTLTMCLFPEIQDLFDLNYKSIMQNLKIISQVLEDRHRLIEQKNEVAHKISKLEGDQMNINDKTENLNQKNKELSSKLEYYKNKISLNDKKYEKEIEKISKEKDEAQKNSMKISLKENQYKHEIKKLESIIEELKAKVKRYMADNKEIKISDIKNERILINNNTIILDNFLKNSPSIIFNQVNYSKDFYNLIYRSYNDKLKTIIQENKDLKECFNFLIKEISQYTEFKKEIMMKLTKEKIEGGGDLFGNFNNIINPDVFNLDFDSAKNEILMFFNVFINSFRFFLIYDLYQVNPETEFNFKEAFNLFQDKKYNTESLPYYKQIKNTIQKLNLDKLEDVKKEVEKVIKNDKRTKKSLDLDLNIPDIHVQENDIANNLDELELELGSNLNNLEEQFKILEDNIFIEIKKASDINPEENKKGKKSSQNDKLI